MWYRCEATSLEGFIQQLAVCYVGRGYWHYVTGRVPPDKNASAVDRKLLLKYGVIMPKWTRSRRKRSQTCSQYPRALTSSISPSSPCVSTATEAARPAPDESSSECFGAATPATTW